MFRAMTAVKAMAAAVTLLVFVAQSAPVRAAVWLTDSVVFSTNEQGENWNGWVWNTVAPPADSPSPGRWNLYYSMSPDPLSPVFINTGNGPSTGIAIEMTVGTHDFLLFGESVTPTLHPLQHFVLGLYFDGNRAAPAISGLFGSVCPTVCAASHWNGLDLFGSGPAQEAGTLAWTSGSTTIALTAFSWAIGAEIDAVWPYWDDSAPYSNGSGTVDFVGRLTLTVREAAEVPVPGSLLLLVAGLALAGAMPARGRRSCGQRPGERLQLS